MTRRRVDHLEIAAERVRQAMPRSIGDVIGCGSRFATVEEVGKRTGQGFDEQRLRGWCVLRGIQTRPVIGGGLGIPAAAWAAVYKIDLGELFGPQKSANPI